MSKEDKQLSYSEAIEEVFCGEDVGMIEEALDDLKVEQLAHLTETLA